MQKNIREIIRQSNVKQWKIAEKIGLSEFTLSRYLRHEPKGELRQRILAALEELEREEAEANEE